MVAVLENVRGIVSWIEKVLKLMKNHVGDDYRILVASCRQVSGLSTGLQQPRELRLAAVYFSLASCESPPSKMDFDATDLGALVRRPRVWFILLRKDCCPDMDQASIDKTGQRDLVRL